MMSELSINLFGFGFGEGSKYFRLPWDQNCLSGWIVEGIYYDLSLAASLFIAMPFLMLFISFLSFHRAFNKIYHSQFKKMDALARNNAFRTYKVKQLLFETVSLEILVKRSVLFGTILS